MNQEYSNQLFKAYMKGRKVVLMYMGLANRIAEKKTLTNAELREVRIAAKALKIICPKWTGEVYAILNKINLGSYKMRFSDPRLTAYTDELCNRWEYSDISYKIYFFEEFCHLDGMVGELQGIIEDYDEALKQKMQLTDPEEDEENRKVSVKVKKKIEAVYKLEYESMSGRLLLNEKEIYKCNLDSKLDKALIAAFKTPYQTIKVDGNLASAISPIRAPESLKRLMFRTGKGCFRVDPEITAEKLERNGLAKDGTRLKCG